ncbi:MAG: hypothetical protein U1F66_00470 [bacterium]
MTPPRAQGVDSGQSFPSFPAGLSRLDPNTAAALPKKFGDEFLPALRRWDEAKTESQLISLFGEGAYSFQLRFHRAELPVSDSPDLKILEGAGLCAGFQVHHGQMSAPDGIGLGGFVALGGLLDFCKIDVNPAGRLILSECPCAFSKKQDITQPVLQSPVGALFPTGRFDPVPLGSLRKLTEGIASGDGQSLGDRLLGALYEATLKAKLPTDLWVDDPPGTPQGSCHPLMAGLEFYFDVPALRKNLAAGLYRSFDFSGIRSGSFVDWPRFRLDLLPLPEGIRIPEGRADLKVTFSPESGDTTVTLKNLDAKLQVPALFGESKVQAKGDLLLHFKSGGAIEVEAKGLRLSSRDFPTVQEPSLAADVTIDGTLSLKYDPAGTGLSLRRAFLQLDNLELKTPAGRGLEIGAGGPVVGLSLAGNAELDYDADAGEEPLWLSGELAGEALGESSGRRLEFRNLELSWNGPFRDTGAGLRPRLEDWSLWLGGDLSLGASGKEAGFELEGLALGWDGDGTKALASAEAKELRFGPLAIQPRLRLVMTPEEGSFWQGTGDLSLVGAAPRFELASALALRTDLHDIEWTLSALHAEQSKRSLAQGGKFRGKKDAQGFRAWLEIPQALGGKALRLSVRQGADSDRLSGEFHLEPDAWHLNSGTELKGLRLDGSYWTPPLGAWLASPRVYLKAQAGGRFEGEWSGPFAAGLAGSLSYSPEKKSLFLWINPKASAPVQVGPLKISGMPGTLEGTGQLQGTWQLVLGPHGSILGGSGVGLKGGVLRWRNGTDPSSPALEVLSNLSLRADQLWSVQKGVAYSGGDGIRFETDLHVDALNSGVPADSGKRHLVYIVDRLPLNLAAYWRLFAKSPPAEGKGP